MKFCRMDRAGICATSADDVSANALPPAVLARAMHISCRHPDGKEQSLQPMRCGSVPHRRLWGWPAEMGLTRLGDGRSQNACRRPRCAGSHLCSRLVGRGERVICLDNFETGRLDNIEDLRDLSEFTLLQHDVAEPFDLDVDQIYKPGLPGLANSRSACPGADAEDKRSRCDERA
jgi:hypothetical protein